MVRNFFNFFVEQDDSEKSYSTVFPMVMQPVSQLPQ